MDLSPSALPDMLEDLRRMQAMIDAQRQREMSAMRIQLGMIEESWYMLRGQLMLIEGIPYAHPSTAMSLRNNGRTPLYTRHMLGVRELERDRRRRG